MNFQDAEILSSYLDGQLSPAETARLEKRLAVDAGLRQLLDDLRVARGLLRQVPRQRVPRNFTLKPAMRGLRAPEPRMVPTLRFASVLAAFVFIATLAVNGLAPMAARNLAAAPAQGYGLGGGGGLGGEPVTATEAAPQAFAAAAPTETPMAEATLTAQDRSAAATSAAAAQAAPKTAPPSASGTGPAQAGPQPPVPPLWQIVLAALAILLGGLAWYTRRRAQRNFVTRWQRK